MYMILIQSIYSKKALNEGCFVEISALQLITQLILQKITPNALMLYDFEYIDKPGEIYRGVIAQELLDTEFREAVILEDGYYKVDYSMLGIEFKKIS